MYILDECSIFKMTRKNKRKLLKIKRIYRKKELHMILYHGSKEVVEYPESEKPDLTNDFILVFIVQILKSRQNDGL